MKSLKSNQVRTVTHFEMCLSLIGGEGGGGNLPPGNNSKFGLETRVTPGRLGEESLLQQTRRL